MKITTMIPDRNKYYLVRTGNSLTDIKRWINWTKKTYPKQKLILVDTYTPKMKNKDMNMRKYWKLRFGSGYEHKYYVYGSYKGG